MQPDIAFISEIRLGVRLDELIHQTCKINLDEIYPSAEINSLITRCKIEGNFYKPYWALGFYVIWLTIKCRYFEGIMCN